MRRVQKSELATLVYDAMFTDLEMAKERNVPFCQDTGVIQYWIECGSEFPLIGQMQACLREATIRATKEAPLRHNAVQIFDERTPATTQACAFPGSTGKLSPGRISAPSTAIWPAAAARFRVRQKS